MIHAGAFIREPNGDYSDEIATANDDTIKGLLEAMGARIAANEALDFPAIFERGAVIEIVVEAA